MNYRLYTPSLVFTLSETEQCLYCGHKGPFTEFKNGFCPDCYIEEDFESIYNEEVNKFINKLNKAYNKTKEIVSK